MERRTIFTNELLLVVARSLHEVAVVLGLPESDVISHRSLPLDALAYLVSPPVAVAIYDLVLALVPVPRTDVRLTAAEDPLNPPWRALASRETIFLTTSAGVRFPLTVEELEKRAPDSMVIADRIGGHWVVRSGR